MNTAATTDNSRIAEAMELLRQAMQCNEAARLKIAAAMRLLQAATITEK